MSDRYGSYPPEEPIIGASTPPPSPSTSGRTIGYASPVDDAAEYIGEDEWDEDEYYDDEYDEEYDDGEYDEYYDDYAPSPVRSPMFYLFIAAAVLVGVAVIILLFAMVGGENSPLQSDFRVSLESPRAGERIEIGKPTQVTVRATSNERIEAFELFVDGDSTDRIDATPPAAGDVYVGVLRLQLERKGEHEIFVRVHGESGATKDTDKVKVQGVEDIGQQPVQVSGRVLTTVTMRQGPGNDFEAAGTLSAGREVNIIGRTRNSEWLLVDVDGGRWVPSTAIDALDPVEFVPVREPTATPQPSPTPTVETTPTPTPTPGNVPDFVPANAVLIDGGSGLRVTVVNQSTSSYSGSLVVSATGVGAAPPSKAFQVDLPANGSVTVDFDLDPPVTDQRTVNIKVDPENAIKETNEDNNGANFVLSPPVNPPNIVIQSANVGADTITVVIRNTGGDLKDASVRVQINVTPDTSASRNFTLSLPQGSGPETLSLPRPSGSGSVPLTVLVNDVPVASINITLD